MPTTILLIILVITLVFFALTRFAVENVAHHHYGQRSDFFKQYPVREGDIVFLGDSITDGGAWEELFPGVPLKNRGINADTTTGVLNRLDDILCCKPLAIFLLIGTNDLPWFEYRSDKAILKTYSEILDRCRTLAPQTRVYVQSLLPRRKNYSMRIVNLNAQLKQLAGQFNFEYIDLYPSFADPSGQLRSELTNDHLHLMAGGYALWVEILTPYINALIAKNDPKIPFTS